MADPESLTEDEFRRLSEFLYRRTRMVFTEAKRYYVQRRVTDRMAATGSTSFASYFARLRTDAGGEVEQFINAFTVNETYFYREDHQLPCLTTDLLPDAMEAPIARMVDAGCAAIKATLEGARARSHG